MSAGAHKRDPFGPGCEYFHSILRATDPSLVKKLSYGGLKLSV